MEDMAAATAFMESIRKLFHALLASAAKYTRLVLVLDGVDHIRYLPLNAIGGPKKLEAYEVAARTERRNSLRGAASTDPFFNVPPALWWLPLEFPIGVHVVISMQNSAAAWVVAQERSWGREAISMSTLSLPAARVLLGAALDRHGVEQAWGHNHGLLFRTMLEDTFVDETLDTARAACAAAPVMRPARHAEAPGGDAPPAVPEVLTPLLPTAGESVRVRVTFC